MHLNGPSSARHVARRALAVMAVGVAFGCLALGAPPRMDGVEGAPPWIARSLEALLPLLVVQLLAVGSFVLWLPDILRGPWRGPRASLGVPLGLLATLAALALLPGVGPILDLAAPHVAAARAAVDDGSGTFTVWRYGTWTALLTLLGVLAVQRSVLVAIRDDPDGRRTARRVLVVILAIAAVECGLGIASTHLGDDTILGLAKVSGRGRVTGSFVLAPMLGVWAGMGACAGAGLAALAWLRGARRVSLACSTLAALCAAGAALSLSRWMLAATAAGLVVTLWCVGRALAAEGRTTGARLLRGAVLLVPVAVVAAAVLVPSLRERMAYALPYLTGDPGPIEPRFAGWESTWDLFRMSPWIGTGIGSFGRAIHLTQSVDAPQEMWFAHSDPLNLLSDGGLLGLGLVLAWLVGCWRHGRGALRSAHAETRILAAAAAGGAVVVLVASLADFQTQFPVVAFPFVALAALPVALGAPPGDSARTSWWQGPRRIVVLLLLVGAVSLGFASSWRARVSHARAGHAPAPSAGEMALAEARTLLGGLRDADDPAADLEQARGLLTIAVQREPFLDAAHLWRALTELSVPGGSRDLALAELGRARCVSRGHAGVNLQIGVLYLDLLGTDAAPAGTAGLAGPAGLAEDTAMDALREAGALVPQAFSRAFQEARGRGLTGADLRRVVPDRAHALQTYAGHLRSVGDPAGARAAERQALEAEPWSADLAERVAHSHQGTPDEPAARALLNVLRLDWPDSR